jgi:outer membrane protein OmpA-like peptidoglycan-associated protein
MKNKKSNTKASIRIEGKRQTELWIYSFADMYMILSVFFISIAVVYALKAKHPKAAEVIPSAGRGPAAVNSLISVEFTSGSDRLTAKAEEDLRILLPVLKSSKGMIELEGYSDGRAVQKPGTGFTSNLDLSNARAVRVGEWLMRNGVVARRLRTYSYGDSYLFKTGEGGIPTNRRVVLKMLPADGG